MPGSNYDTATYDDALYDGAITPGPVVPPIYVKPPSGQPAPQSVYQVRLYDTTGMLKAVFDEWNSLYFYNRLNDYGYHTFSIDGSDPRASLFTVDSLVEVRRRNVPAGIQWYREYIAFHRTSQYQITDRGRVLFSSFGRALEDLVRRRVVLFKAGSLTYNTIPADDVMKSLVRFNAGPLAVTANGRIADGVTPGFAVAADSSLAPAWSGERSYKNLLDVVKEVSTAKLVDFDVTWTGGQNFVFSTYYPQRGFNRTGVGPAPPLVFSIEHGNMSEPYLTDSRMEEVTAVYVLGQGEGPDRMVVERLNPGELSQSPWNRNEDTRDARNETTTSALADIGDAHLNDHGDDRHISFQIVSSPGSLYGRDYNLGDTVLARVMNVEEIRKITGAEITVADGKETIRIHFGGE